MAAEVGERPAISPLARRQVERGEPVTTRRHEIYQPGEFESAVLRHMDGTNDRAAILAKVMNGVRSGKLSVEQDGKPVADAVTAEPLVSQALVQVFERFARCALLVEV